jgi:hypothetical protein
VRQPTANSTAFVDVSVINPTSKYLGKNLINLFRLLQIPKLDLSMTIT